MLGPARQGSAWPVGSVRIVQRSTRGVTQPEARLAARLAASQRAVANAERARDDLARHALAAGLGVRAVARALGVNKATVSRRYRLGRVEHP